MKTVRYHLAKVKDVLIALQKVTSDTSVCIEVALIYDSVRSCEFVLTLVMYYDILVEANAISELSETEATQLELGMRHFEAFVTWLEDYQKLGFASTRTTANSLCGQLELSNEL